jgi:hypothetical protein
MHIQLHNSQLFTHGVDYPWSGESKKKRPTRMPFRIVFSLRFVGYVQADYNKCINALGLDEESIKRNTVAIEQYNLMECVERSPCGRPMTDDERKKILVSRKSAATGTTPQSVPQRKRKLQSELQKEVLKWLKYENKKVRNISNNWKQERPKGEKRC